MLVGGKRHSVKKIEMGKKFRKFSVKEIFKMFLFVFQHCVRVGYGVCSRGFDSIVVFLGGLKGTCIDY